MIRFAMPPGLLSTCPGEGAGVGSGLGPGHYEAMPGHMGTVTTNTSIPGSSTTPTASMALGPRAR